MKKKYILLSATILMVLITYVFFRAQQSQIQPQQVGQNTKTPDIAAGIDRQHTNSLKDLRREKALSARKSRHFFGSRYSVSNAATNTTSTIASKEEAARIEQMFAVTGKLYELLDDGDHTGALLEARKFVSHPNREVRMAALDALKWVGAPATSDIISFVGDSDPEISQTAEEAFWEAIDEINDPILKISMVKTSLKSPSQSLRLEAVYLLGFLPEHLAFPVIASAMNDSDAEVRDMAKENLEFISSEEFESESQAMSWFQLHKDELADSSTY